MTYNTTQQRVTIEEAKRIARAGVPGFQVTLETYGDWTETGVKRGHTVQGYTVLVVRRGRFYTAAGGRVVPHHTYGEARPVLVTISARVR